MDLQQVCETTLSSLEPDITEYIISLIQDFGEETSPDASDPASAAAAAANAFAATELKEQITQFLLSELPAEEAEALCVALCRQLACTPTVVAGLPGLALLVENDDVTGGDDSVEEAVEARGSKREDKGDEGGCAVGGGETDNDFAGEAGDNEDGGNGGDKEGGNGSSSGSGSTGSERGGSGGGGGGGGGETETDLINTAAKRSSAAAPNRSLLAHAMSESAESAESVESVDDAPVERVLLGDAAFSGDAQFETSVVPVMEWNADVLASFVVQRMAGRPGEKPKWADFYRRIAQIISETELTAAVLLAGGATLLDEKVNERNQ